MPRSGIDFVVLWVDGDDPAWQAERELYLPGKQALQPCENGGTQNRFRDWGLMRYWFRGVERFAPWVDNVWFVTNGQKPAWLCAAHPKLHCISHRDYIPAQFLPTFNSNVIELFLHNIPDLSEKFVLFNDDMFLVSPTPPDDFFDAKTGLPRESALLDAPGTSDPGDCLPHMLLNNAAILNRHFDKREVLKRNAGKFFSPRYGGDLLRNVLLAPFTYFCAFRDPHLPSSYRKCTFETVWEKEHDALLSCAPNRFRSKNDYTHWLMKCWQICEGNFSVRGNAWGRHYELWEDDIDTVCKGILSGRYRAVCVNDSKTDIDFEDCRAKLGKCFAKLLPEKSEYEIDVE